MAPAHATVDSTLAKFRMPGTSCLTTCALAAAAIRPTTVNSASVGISGCMPAPPFEVYIHLIRGRRTTEARHDGGSPVLSVDGASAGGARADAALRCGVLGRRYPLDPVQCARRAGAGAV